MLMSKPTGKSKRTCRLEGDKLIITMSGKATTYTVTNTCPDPKVASPAFALQKEDGTVHHVCVDEHGPRCDCADSHYRSRLCKHARSLQVLGLIPKED